MKYDLNTLQNNRTTNKGGICKMEFVPKEWLANDVKPDLHDGAVYGKPTLITGKDWIKADFEQDSKLFEEELKAHEAGEFAEQNFIGFISKETLETNNLLNNMRYHEYVLILYTRNALPKIIGNKKRGVTYGSKFTSGKTFADRELYTISFEHSSVDKAFVLVV